MPTRQEFSNLPWVTSFIDFSSERSLIKSDTSFPNGKGKWKVLHDRTLMDISLSQIFCLLSVTLTLNCDSNSLTYM